MSPRDWNIVDDDAPAPDPPRGDGLDERRIRAVTLERRAADRSRVRAAVVAPSCVGVAIMASFRAVAAGAASPLIASACGVTAIVAAFVAIRVIKARRSTTTQAEPAAPPDFTSLGGDGGAADRLRAMGDP